MPSTDILSQAKHHQSRIFVIRMNRNHSKPPNYHSAASLTTLVHRLGIRKYFVTKKTLNGVKMLVLIFPGSGGPRLTLLTPAASHFGENNRGEAELDVHRKFLTSYGKFLHWISFGFPGQERRVQAQIMLPTRIQAAIEMVSKGTSAAFLDCPPSLQRRGQANKRIVRMGRSKDRFNLKNNCFPVLN